MNLDTLLPSGDAIFLHRPHGEPCHGITEEVIRDFESLAHLVLANPKGAPGLRAGHRRR
jgi:hypothetical protein